MEDPQIPHSLADQGPEWRQPQSWIIALVVFLPRATPANPDIPKVLQPHKAARSSVDQVFNQGLWWGKQFILRP